MNIKIANKLKSLRFTVVIVILAIFMALSFVFAAISLISAFLADSGRIASEATYSLQKSLSECEEKIVTQTSRLANASSAYEKVDTGVDSYQNLFNSFEEDGYYSTFSSILLFDESGLHASAQSEATDETSKHEIIDETYVDLVKELNQPFSYVRRSTNNVSKSFNLYTYYPVVEKKTEQGDSYGAYCIVTVAPVEKIYLDESVNAVINKFSAQAYLVDTTNSAKNFFLMEPNGFVLGTKTFFNELKENYSVSFAEELLASNERTTIDHSGEKYIITKTAFGSALSGTEIVVIYKELTLQTVENPYFIQTIISFIIAILSLALVSTLVVLEINRLREKNRKEEESIAFLDCNTALKFKREAENIIIHNRSMSYALVGISFANISYLRENFGEDMEMDVKKYIANVISSVIRKNETFGLVSDAYFVMLLNYEEKAEVASKITLIMELINHYGAFEKMNFLGQFHNGVYYIQPTDKIDIDEFVNRQNIALLSHKKEPTKKFSVYDRKVFEDYQIQAEIEAKMESALKNGNFHLLYQPKYSIKKDKIEGAETLIRWYDPERKAYIPPNRFIHLFELNGFINKLDRYIFTSVCEFLANAMRNRLNITGINVNVSRVTATQKDFIQYYVNTKRKYGIPDGYITIEFTESFSFTDMNVLRQIAIDLHKYGFRCAIDDFGSGYSSIGVLKELPVDELKLDMFLLNKTDNEKNDKALLNLIVQIGKAFNMVVTQEGVETEEQWNMLKELGCDQIQGFYYAKPMFADDFQNFVTHPNDIVSVRENRANINYRKIKYVDFFSDSNPDNN